jgi:hypothetical protein
MATDHNPYAPPSVHDTPNVDEVSPYRSTRTISLVVRALLGVGAAVSAISIAHSFTQLDLFERIKQGRNFTLAEAEASDMQSALVLGLYLLVFIPNVITWCIWQQRTSQNARALGTEYMQFGPKAWGWFFCPIINLYRPFAVVRELWWVSHPNSGPDAPSYFGVWWATWIIGSLLGNASGRLARGDADIGQLILSVQLDIGSSVVLIVSAIFAIKVVAEIHRREDARARGGGNPH